jgi:hypothetical protein
MRKLLQSAAIASAGLLIATTGAANAAQATPTKTAGTWLHAQLTHGLIHNSQFNSNDYGLTADTALALKKLGASNKSLKKTRKALATHVNDWMRGFATSTDLYAGSVAKAAVTAEALGANPKAFGGENLIKLLAGTVSKSGATRGRIQDRSSADYENTLGQALAAQALATSAPKKAKPVVNYLLKQQCSGGYFRLYFPAAGQPQTCDAGDKATTSVPDPDATSSALLSLQQLPKQTAKVKKAEKKATRWLLKHQAKNGSFVGGSSTQTSNTNSTGLAAAALAGAGKCQQARKAATWVEKLQVGKTKGALASAKGAIAYDKAGLAAAKSAGITTATQDQWRRATAQAAPALRYLAKGSCA